jgi:hypothetical protein
MVPHCTRSRYFLPAFHWSLIRPIRRMVFIRQPQTNSFSFRILTFLLLTPPGGRDLILWMGRRGPMDGYSPPARKFSKEEGVHHAGCRLCDLLPNDRQRPGGQACVSRHQCHLHDQCQRRAAGPGRNQVRRDRAGVDRGRGVRRWGCGERHGPGGHRHCRVRAPRRRALPHLRGPAHRSLPGRQVGHVRAAADR